MSEYAYLDHKSSPYHTGTEGSLPEETLSFAQEEYFLDHLYHYIFISYDINKTLKCQKQEWYKLVIKYYFLIF